MSKEQHDNAVSGVDEEASPQGAFAFDTPAAAIALGVQAARPDEDRLANALEWAYDRIAQEVEQRRVQTLALRAELRERIGFDIPLGQFMSEGYDATKLNEVVIRLSVAGENRAIVGLDSECWIDSEGLVRTSAAAIETARVDHWGQHKQSRRTGTAPPFDDRLDVKGLLASLRASFGGRAGLRLRQAKLAKRVSDAASLAHQEFQPAAGKVTLKLSARYCTTFGYSYERKRDLATIADGLRKIAMDAGGIDLDTSELSAAATSHEMAPGMTLKLGSHGTVKTFKDSIKIQLTKHLAGILRRFIGEALTDGDS